MNERVYDATLCRTVTTEQTAKAMGSGSLAVLATPALVALMEECACKALEGFLEEGQTSVGTALTMHHTAATPVGMEVRVKAEVSKIDGRKIVFTITAEDEKGEIGNCTHERFLVMAERFTEKTYQKLER
ncbi:MAG: thioesterase family protein [Clostridia bacterium]|nr:thioesterase family protein [Clostridia bacterium]